MDKHERLLATWAGISASLYLLMVFGAAIILGKSHAFQLATAAMGLNYISYTLPLLKNVNTPRWVQGWLFILIFVIGLMAGLALLI